MMQRRIGNEVLLGNTVSPLLGTGQSSSIDRTASNFLNVSEKVYKIKRLINTGEYDADLAKYISGMIELVYQGMIENIDTKKQVARISYKDLGTLEFQIMLTNEYYANPNTNFFLHFVKEISIMRYGNNKQLMPTFSP